MHTLDECQAEQHCEITALKGDLETKLRLVNLGFHTHSHIKVVMVRDQAIVVCVDGSRFAIDKSLAQNIEIGEPL
ncbi:FeoA family protein [Galenea microaerophila]